MYTVLIGLLAGSVSAWAIGNSSSWWRVIPATVLGLSVAVAVDMAYPYLDRMTPDMLARWVALPLIGPYGLTLDGMIAIPLGLVGAALAALRNYNRIAAPNDLRR